MLTRGRLLETILKAEQGAVPAAWLVTTHSGDPGTPPGGHYDPPARSSLCPDRHVAGPDTRGRVDKSASGAPRGGRVDRKTRAVPSQGTVSNIAPPGAPLPLVMLEGDMAKLGRVRRENNSCCPEIR